jgi:hypothetical protein
VHGAHERTPEGAPRTPPPAPRAPPRSGG